MEKVTAFLLRRIVTCPWAEECINLFFLATFIFPFSFSGKVKLLFICNQNKHRSKTAEHLFKGAFETRSAGLYNEHPVTAQQLRWADVVVVMENEQRTELSRRFPAEYLKKRIVSLDIPDVYSYNQSSLINLLKTRLRHIL